MNAQELTKRYDYLNNDVYELKKQVEYLTQECEKLRRFYSDMQIDIKMLSTNRRA